MPPGKRRQSNAMLYTLITFVGLFIAATTVAVIYYVKAEELRTRSDELQQEMDRLASREEVRNMPGIVGAKLPGQSNFGTVVEYLNDMVRFVKGTPVQPTSAEVKVANARQAVEPLLTRAGNYITLPAAGDQGMDPNAVDPNNPTDPNAAGPNQVALTYVIGELLARLDQTTEQRDAAEKQLGDLRQRFDAAIATMRDTEQALTAKVGEYRQQVDQIKTDYNDLRALVEQNSDERAKTLLDQLEQVRADARQSNQDLLRTQAELNVAQGRLQGALATVSDMRPAPDRESVAYRADGEVIMVNEAAGTVHINLGSEDHVYRGLTFSVYDRSAGITRDGKPKAEVEILAIDRRVATARILSSDRKNPIVTGDRVANLIWDANHENEFVVAGEFDLNGDGMPDYDAIRKIEALIRKWGGKVSEQVSATTDFVILGKEPQVPPEPTLDMLAIDPTATDKYNAARQGNEQYNQIRQRAEALWVPIFSYDRFLHFTGYASQVNKPGAF